MGAGAGVAGVGDEEAQDKEGEEGLDLVRCVLVGKGGKAALAPAKWEVEVMAARELEEVGSVW